MKKLACLLFFCLLPLCSSLSANSIVGESASYFLNGDRTSWLIEDGQATAFVMSYQTEDINGPGYVVELEYDVNVLFKGNLKGRVGLLVPEKVFTEEFAADLSLSHPQKVGGFHMDYLGLEDAEDSDGKLYKNCHVARVYDIDPNYKPMPVSDPNMPKLLYHQSIGPKMAFENLQIFLRVDYSVPVLGAVQLDISAKAMGFDIYAGFDYAPKKNIDG